MSSIFYCLRLPPKFSMKWLLRGLTLPSLYIIMYYDNTVTYIWVAWSCDTKEIIAIPFEVIPMWIIEEYKIRRARSGFYFDVNEVICPRTSKFSSYNRYPGSLCRKELKKGNGSISDKYSNLEINWILMFDAQSFPKVMSGRNTRHLITGNGLTDREWHLTLFSLQSV